MCWFLHIPTMNQMTVRKLGTAHMPHSTCIPAQQIGTEHLHPDDVHAPLSHVPYSPSYVPTSEQV